MIMQNGPYALSCLHCDERILLSGARLRQMSERRTLTCGECGHTAHLWQLVSAQDAQLPAAARLYRKMSAGMA